MKNIEIAKKILSDSISEIKYSGKMLQTPEEMMVSKSGDCLEQTELARHLLESKGISCTTYFMEINRGGKNTSTWKHFAVHGFVVFESEGKVCWFEHAFAGGRFIGVHEYDSLKDLLIDFRHKATKYFRANKMPVRKLKIRQYEKPKYPKAYTAHLLDCLDAPEII